MQGKTREAAQQPRPTVNGHAAATEPRAAKGSRSIADLGHLIDTLVTGAGEALAKGEDDAAARALEEAQRRLPTKRPSGEDWRVRTVHVFRATAGLAQKQGRHADAVAAFEKAIAAFPALPATAGRDANAAKLQLLVHLARSRLALGQAQKTEADMRTAQKLATALEGAIPERAIETVRAAILANSGVALAALGKMDDAETAFATSVSTIDRLATPELAGLRAQVLSGWAGALRKIGRAADADAMLAAFATPSPHVHGAKCGCGHEPGKGTDHASARHHHHAGGGCDSHSD